jgi:hypothetical protein
MIAQPIVFDVHTKDALAKREGFAISLRKKKKAQILKNKRARFPINRVF